MTHDDHEALTRAARQLIALEQLLGGDFLPANLNPLPEIELPEPAPADDAAPAAAPIPADMTPRQKADILAAMDTGEVQTCTLCGLSANRTNTVFGAGDPDADLMFVGEAPGHDEDLSGQPFVGRAGELLTKMIHAMGLTRDDVFIGNMVKCRPPQNRTPMPDEVQSCWPYLVRQLQIIRPKCIVTLGNPATKGLLDTTIGITRMRGNWQRLPNIAPGLEGVPVMPTFHPAYVLRQYNAETRGKVWSDLQQVMSHLGLSLPEKKT